MINYITKYIFLLIMLLPQVSLAQFNMLFTSDYELPNSLVNKVAEDSNGMLWVATEDGLCLFNGSRFKTFRHVAGDSNSLANDFVRTVFTDAKGNVIVGSIEGVQVYRPLTGDFTPVITNVSDGIKSGNVNDIALMHDGNFLVIGSDCYILSHSNGEWRVQNNSMTRKIDNVFRGVEAKDGSIFVTKGAGGVLHIDKHGKIQRVNDSKGHLCNISALCVGPDGKLYGGSADAGLYVYSPTSNCFDYISGTEHLSQICEIEVFPSSQMLCVATDVVGVQMFDVRTQRCVDSQQFISPMVDISKQKVHSLYINQDGDVWMALFQRGIFMATSKKTAFSFIGPRSQQNNLIDEHCVTSLLQTHDGNIWATTDNGGLYGFTSALTPYRKYPADVRPNSVPATILGLFEDSKHRVWFGSYGRGGGIIDLSSGICNSIPIAEVPNNDFNVYGYAEDKRGQIWVASMGNGILRYDETKKVFVSYISKNQLAWSGAIYYDAQHDRIYCGTYDGIISFSPTDKTKSQKTVLPESIVYSITRASADVIAFATNKGLVLLTISTGQIRTITTEQGLPSNNICAVQSSGDGCLWISTMSGLTRLSLKTMTSETFTIRDGLQGNEFYKNTSIVTRDGRLWFGGINGITSFFPRDVKSTHVDCKVRVVDLRADETYLLSDENGCYIIPDGVKSLSVSFATLPLYMTHRVTYSYRMDNGKWVMLPAPQNRISFNNLSYGSHTLQVKTFVDGKDSDITDTHIYIKYPWYLKWWMVIIWFALFSIFAYFFFVNVQRRRSLHERFRRHQQEQEMKETKLQFFMNVVHDLRTPLTLIVTPLQKLQKSDGDVSRQHLYGIMGRNTDRLLRLTNEIMDLRKLDRGKMELHPHNFSISRIITETVDSMSNIAETHRQEIVLTDHTDGKQHILIDAQALDKILVNLLSNALKYTPDGGRIEVEWNVDSIPSESHQLTLSVTDDGVGISDSEKKRIFERFYQVRVNDKHIKGTGIGLNLVKALVELHKGDISVSDNPAGKGTRFTVTLPVSIADANSEESMEVISVAGGIAGVGAVDEKAEEVSNTSSRGAKCSHTILVVDDDDDIRNFLIEELSNVYSVLEASNGKIAYDILSKENVDIVVSDIMMPEVDGIELTHMIRKNVRIAHLSIILLTAKSTDQDRIEGLQTTADAYVTKPFNLELLETVISNILLRQDKLRNTFKGNENPADRIDTPEVVSADDKLMERLVKVINDNLANPDLTSEMLAREVGLSRVHMYRKLKELTNQSATNYIRNIRLTKAAEILRQGKSTVSEVAYLVGFRTPTHFSSAFKDLYGVTPKEYMNKE